MLKNIKGQTIWIIGASSGIGKALAHHLATQGATLILSARRADTLQDIMESLSGDGHQVYPLDVQDTSAIFQTVQKITTANTSLHRILFMSATYNPSSIEDMEIEFIRKSMDVNLISAMALTQALIPVLKKQPFGQLAFCGSVAGYMGLPNGQPYSATKAGLINFTECLHAELYANKTTRHIDIKLLSPGFVRTPMTDKNTFHMPFRIEPEDASKAIIAGLKSSRFEIHFPKMFTCLLKCIAILPYGIQNWLTSKIK